MYRTHCVSQLSRQKGVIFCLIAGNMMAKTAIGMIFRGVALRDCFSKERNPDAQRLAQRGLGLKIKRHVAVFNDDI